MKSKKDQYILTFAITFEILLLITAIVNLINGIKRNCHISLISILCVPFPFILNRLADKKSITLPPRFKAITLLFIFGTQYLGELVGFYFTLWWWDLLLHAFAGFYGVIIGAFLIESVIYHENQNSSKRHTLFLGILAFSFSTTMSTLWEIFEYIADTMLKTNMLQDGFRDTFQDLLAGEIFALVGAIIIYLKLKFKNSSSL